MTSINEEYIQNCFNSILHLHPSRESTARAINHIKQTIERQVTPRTYPWSFPAKSKLASLAAAAVIIIGIYIGFIGLGQPGVVWANVAQHVQQAKTIQFRLWVRTTGLPDAEIRICDSSEYGSRLDLYVEGKNTIKIYAPKDSNEFIMIGPKGQILSRTSFTDDQRQQMIQRQKDPREFVKLFLAENPKKLGRQTVEGIQTEGLEVTSPKVGGGLFENAIGRIWADVKTYFPVRMEIEGISGGGKIQTHIIMDQFIWDAPLEADEFDPVISPTAQPIIEMKTADPDENNLIEGLRFFAEQNEGRYPSSLAPMTLDAELRQIHKDKHSGQPFTPEEQAKVPFLTAAGQFYQALVEKDCMVEYHGNTVTATDADKELLQWKISDEEFRVIYGDLHTETIADTNELLNMALAVSGKTLEPDKRGPVLRILNLSEKDLIRGLAVWLELLDGRYPDSLNPKTSIKQADSLLEKKFGPSNQPDKQKQDLLKAKTYDIFFASTFYDKLVQEKKEVVYYGDKITAIDSGRILVRWKISKKNYRVIFGNLDSKSVTAEELAELEKQSQN